MFIQASRSSEAGSALRCTTQTPQPWHPRNGACPALALCTIGPGTAGAHLVEVVQSPRLRRDSQADVDGACACAGEEHSGGRASRTSNPTSRPSLPQYQRASMSRAPIASTRKAKCPTPRAPVTMSSYLGLDPARRCPLHCARVGALSSRCNTAALGADRAGQLRARRYYPGL